MMQRVRKMIGRYDSGIWIRVVGSAMSTVTSFMIRPFLVLYLYHKIEGSVFLPMLVVGLAPLCGMIVSWYGSGLSDRLGRKPIMFGSLLLQMLCMIGYAFAGEIWQYIAVSVINGIGAALFMPAANAQMTDMVPAERRAEVFALLHTGFNVGAAVGPILGLLMFRVNPMLVFFLSAASFLLNALLVYFKLPETSPLVVNRKISGASEVAASSASKRPGGFRILFGSERMLLFVTLFTLPIGFLYALAETALTIHLGTHFAKPQDVFGWMLSFNGVMVILLQIWIARKTEAYRSYAVVGVSYALFTVVAFGYGYGATLIVLFAAEFVFTLGEMMNGPHMQKVISLMASEEKRGYYFTVFGASRLLAQGLGPILGGLLLASTNGETLFTVLAVLLAGAGVAQYRVMKREEESRLAA
ncbi:MFS transporter [Cohnella pontilimi]|uniref:MFS transporter n=1 Tax=Cohnella pontilimi TaxID=2564100 RepID=A0A4U0F617_9BACL|nr:MFS transporter [Cohnella pontilimi]TJY39718.1 MFS transporter [Cohnella pontilimi]